MSNKYVRLELAADACAVIELALRNLHADDLEGFAACVEIEGTEAVKMPQSEGYQCGQRIATIDNLLMILDSAVKVEVTIPRKT